MTLIFDKDRITYPILGILGNDKAGQDLLNEYATWMMGAPRPVVQAHKTQFGRQAYCYTSWRRLWVWEFVGYRVFVNNVKGIVFECNTQSRQEAERALRDYLARWKK